MTLRAFLSKRQAKSLSVRKPKPNPPPDVLTSAQYVHLTMAHQIEAHGSAVIFTDGAKTHWDCVFLLAPSVNVSLPASSVYQYC